ncbi:hypothetical protein HQ346_24795 [Rhodococcus sp. BP-252]|uniref:hypothetical protein n=1 Tax=unclassified Rhodococcus (in: high G+C Gram-positive bacteria) TaxID=192944 RepID=UPI001C9B2326|nr:MULTISPECIES: hypothetical protein [unclassified Rhodococcus (in: high G+C Gram-positive bacteria)]MBY6414826.1 hypothetical protein [Rhodococcus sp. BP-320]MBY6419729.1 hypothetical protein [Rhodococcus sp. BP-321]MBY6424702.1 hypothetical protein [Rhodococcus sp. BP-324]MBY6429704.1 hypothetical protein [Rhodococcus sp. BP-323]MBY6434676.1 hypothetical protein [Rhodococcus sp. BP-322]
MNIGDRYRVATSGTIVVVRTIHGGGLVTVENEDYGPGVHPFYMRAEDLMPVDQ